VKPDARSFRIALVADRYVNPPPGGLDALAVAAQLDWGVMALPADDYPDEIAGPLLAVVVPAAITPESPAQLADFLARRPPPAAGGR
jgi:hypothetical protein